LRSPDGYNDTVYRSKHIVLQHIDYNTEHNGPDHTKFDYNTEHNRSDSDTEFNPKFD